jgi:hypothetical protein
MFDRLKPHVNHATIVAYLALFVALGGTSMAALKIGSAQIKNNSVRSTDLRNNDVRGKDIRKGSVNSSDISDGSLTGNDINESSLGTVPRATTADSAGNAGTLDGIDSTGFLSSSPPEAFHEVGAPGQPGFGAGWSNPVAGETTVAFFKDPFGVVHLKGHAIRSGGGNTVFTLPAGYRPSEIACFSIARGDVGPPPVPGVLCIFTTGVVEQVSGTGAWLLNGITFRAAAG